MLCPRAVRTPGRHCPRSSGQCASTLPIGITVSGWTRNRVFEPSLRLKRLARVPVWAFPWCTGSSPVMAAKSQCAASSASELPQRDNGLLVFGNRTFHGGQLTCLALCATWSQVRNGLSGGGKRIRTRGPCYMADAFESILVAWLAFVFLPEKPTRSQGGTDGSNPLSSSAESCANRCFQNCGGVSRHAGPDCFGYSTARRYSRSPESMGTAYQKSTTSLAL